MLQEIKICNFLSFRDETIFSFEASADKTFEPSHVVEVAPGVRLLRFAMILGANASGKSNLLRAIEFLRRFWFERKQVIDEPTNAVPFMLNQEKRTEPSVFELKFWTKGVKYWYVLKLDVEKVIEERLYYYRGGSVQPTSVFRRQLDESGHSVITFNPAVLKVSNAAAEEIQLKCLRNVSFFVARNQVNLSLPVVDEARDWMRTGIMPIVEPDSAMFDVAKQKLKENGALRDYMLDFLHQADFNITDVRSNKDKVMEFIHTVKNEKGEEHYVMSEGLQSLGTQRTFGLETTIFDALQKQALLPCDEFDASMHPDLLEFVIQRFLQEKSESQLVVTTHYDPLLATIDDLIRKDNVWFTEKGEDGSTQLYALTNFKGLTKMSSMSIRNAYRNGQFGALPKIV